MHTSWIWTSFRLPSWTASDVEVCRKGQDKEEEEEADEGAKTFTAIRINKYCYLYLSGQHSRGEEDKARMLVQA